MTAQLQPKHATQSPLDRGGESSPTASLRAKRILVMGLGRFGGGIGVTRWLLRQGAYVRVTDVAPAEKLTASIEALKGLDVTYHLGGHDLADLNDCDLLVVSPAVNKETSDFFKAAQARGIPWTSEMNLFLERCPARIVGITGTVGKSTTTAMVGAVLSAASNPQTLKPSDPSSAWPHGRVWLGGNIGKSLLDDLTAIRPEDVVILELSSFQLEDAASLGKSPHIALVTNVRENHLDRHGTLDVYAAAKANIFRFQTPDDWLVLPLTGAEACLESRGHGSGTNSAPQPPTPNALRTCRYTIDPKTRQVRIIWPDSPPLPLRERDGVRVTPCSVEAATLDLTVPGVHNLWNAAAALTIARILGVPTEIAQAALRAFPGLPHRLEFVREIDGVRYFNDSKATTPEAAMTALAAFDQPIIALCGGSDKGGSFDELGRALAARCKAVVCMGATREKIAAAITSAAACGFARPTDEDRRVGTAHLPQLKLAGSFTEAVQSARRFAAPGDVVLLTPACASFDWFTNYEERGDVFKRIVQQWQSPANRNETPV